MLGARDLRVFCRPPMGVPVEFAGVSTYPDGQTVCGLFDRPVSVQFEDHGTAGFTSGRPELRLPRDAFAPMPGDGDLVTVTDEGVATVYIVSEPTAEGDGAFQVYELHATGPGTVAIQASATDGQSLASDVLDAVVAALGGNAARVYRCRFRPFGAQDLPARNVLPDMESVDYAYTGTVQRAFRFMVRHIAATTADADKVADAAAVQTARALGADPTLGGLVRILRETGSRWEMDEQELQMVALVVTYEVEFSTSRRDPSVPGY